VIGAGLGREDHGSIPRNCDRKKAGSLEPLDAKTYPRTRLGGLVGWILVVKKESKNNYVPH
jgi:hypothetical protein